MFLINIIFFYSARQSRKIFQFSWKLGCCAEVIFGPRLSVDQNKSQVIQKSIWSISNSTIIARLFQICSTITMRSITTWKIKFHVKSSKVEAAEKMSNSDCFISFKWPQMLSEFIWHLFVSLLLLTIYFRKSVILLTTLFVLVLNHNQQSCIWMLIWHIKC